MEDSPRVVSVKEINESVQLTFQPGALVAQYVGTFAALVLCLLFGVPSLYFLPTGLLLLTVGFALAYIVLGAAILISSSIQRQQGPIDLRPLLQSLKARLIRSLLYGLGCVITILLLGIPLLTLIFIGDVEAGGQLLLSIFMIPLLVLIIAQVLIGFFGLFVLPQFLASEYGRRADQFQAFREMLSVGWYHLSIRHAVSSILALALALPFWLIVDFSVKLLGFLTASAIKISPEQQVQFDLLPPVLRLIFEHLTLFPHVWLNFSISAQVFAVLAAAFVYAIPLTVAILFQSASGLQALRAISFDREYFDYPPTA
ncbi:MAG: hypothetical protein O3B01_00340 [Planctomycetota bacterium]|nr:hypothetical protein [Planctomycetota bacterium]MDA1137001.1 hypothetical protein [Planctomycetota bacterium]